MNKFSPDFYLSTILHSYRRSQLQCDEVLPVFTNRLPLMPFNQTFFGEEEHEEYATVQVRRAAQDECSRLDYSGLRGSCKRPTQFRWRPEVAYTNWTLHHTNSLGQCCPANTEPGPHELPEFRCGRGCEGSSKSGWQESRDLDRRDELPLRLDGYRRHSGFNPVSFSLRHFRSEQDEPGP